MSTWVIDTSVLEYLLDNGPSGINSDKHIHSLMRHWIAQDISIGVDSKRRIIGEYSNRLSGRIAKAPEGVERQLLTWAITKSLF